MNVPSWLKTSSSIVAAIAVIAGAVIAAEDRYVNENEAVQSMQQMQQTLETRMDIIQYDFYTEQYMKSKQQLRRNPSDPMAIEEYNAVKKKKDALHDKLFK